MTLPARPSIDWLRKAAKDHLSELRVSHPAARLETYFPRRKPLDRTIELLGVA